MPLDLSGLMVAQVTPFTEDGAAVDYDWLPAHLRFLEEAGIRTAFPLGTNGEGPSVGLEERKRVVETVVRHKGTLGVVAGAGCVALPDTIRAANDAFDAGADAVALLPPYFYHDLDAAGLVRSFSAVIETLPAEGRVLLYNIPPRTHVDIPDEVVLALLDLYPDQLIGIKDSSGDPERTRRYLDLSDDFTVLAGADGCHAELYAVGCVGGVTGVGNAVPSLVAAVQHAHRSGGDATRAQREVNELKAILRRFPPFGALKQLIALTANLPLTHARPPNRDLTAEEAGALREAVSVYLVGARA